MVVVGCYSASDYYMGQDDRYNGDEPQIRPFEQQQPPVSVHPSRFPTDKLENPDKDHLK